LLTTVVEQYGGMQALDIQCVLNHQPVKVGAVERTRTSTPLPGLAPQASASTIPPRPLVINAPDRFWTILREGGRWRNRSSAVDGWACNRRFPRRQARPVNNSDKAV